MSHFDEDAEEFCDEDSQSDLSPAELLAAECPRLGCIFCRGPFNPKSIGIKELTEKFLAELENPALAEERRNKEVWRFLGVMPAYEEHIKSDWWFHIRRFVIRTAEELNGCEDCGISQRGCWKKQGKGYHVHHVTYARMGNEHPEDLIALCPACHAKRHNKQPEKA